MAPAGWAAFRPSDDRSRAAASFAAVSFLSLKNPNDGREQTGTLSTTGVEYDRSITRERDRRLEWTLPAGELELRSSPWNTILPEEFMRGESTEATDGGGGVAGRRRAGLCAACGGADAGGGQWRCGGAEAGGWQWRWGWERTSLIRGFGVRSTESREWRGKSSWSWAEEEDDDDMEKREEARERDASESELSRRSGDTERSDAAAPDARPPFRWRRSSLRDLAADELDALDGVAGTGEGDCGGDGDADGFCGVWTFLSRSSSRQRLEHVGALGENT